MSNYTITEEWKNIPNYEKKYQVSSMGRVRSLDRIVQCRYEKHRTVKGRILKQRVNPEGRLYVSLSSKSNHKTFKVHKLVAMAFLGHKPNGYNEVVDHKNNNPLDNSLNNLQLITQRLNSSKDRKNKSSKYTGCWFCKTTKKWKSEIRIHGKRFNLGSFHTESDAYKAYQEVLKSLSKSEAEAKLTELINDGNTYKIN